MKTVRRGGLVLWALVAVTLLVPSQTGAASSALLPPLAQARAVSSDLNSSPLSVQSSAKKPFSQPLDAGSTASTPISPTASITAAVGSATPPVSATVPAPVPSPMPPVSATVSLLQIGAYTVADGQEHPVTVASAGSHLRFKLVVAVSAPPTATVAISATWGLRGVFSYQRSYTLASGRVGLYDDVTLPSGLHAGRYLFLGRITYRGQAQTLTMPLRLLAGLAPGSKRVHYAHLQLTVPAGWTVDTALGPRGAPVSNGSSLIVFSNSRRAALTVISANLGLPPPSAAVRGYPAALLHEEFTNVSHVVPFVLPRKIDGHTVLAARGVVQLVGHRSSATAIVTLKGTQFYGFTLLSIGDRASTAETAAAITMVFGATLDPS